MDGPVVTDFAPDVKVLRARTSLLLDHGFAFVRLEQNRNCANLRETVLRMLKENGSPPQGKWGRHLPARAGTRLQGAHASTMLTRCKWSTPSFRSRRGKSRRRAQGDCHSGDRRLRVGPEIHNPRNRVSNIQTSTQVSVFRGQRQHAQYEMTTSYYRCGCAGATATTSGRTVASRSWSPSPPQAASPRLRLAHEAVLPTFTLASATDSLSACRRWQHLGDRIGGQRLVSRIPSRDNSCRSSRRTLNGQRQQIAGAAQIKRVFGLGVRCRAPRYHVLRGVSRGLASHRPRSPIPI